MCQRGGMVVAHVHRRAARHCAAGSGSASWTPRQAHAHAHGAPPVSGHRTRGGSLRKPRAALLNRAQSSSAETATSSSALPEPASRTRRRPSERGQHGLQSKAATCVPSLLPNATASPSSRTRREWKSPAAATILLSDRMASTARAHRERHQATIGSGHRQRASNWLTIGIGEIGSCSLRQDNRHGPRLLRSNRGPPQGRRGALVEDGSSVMTCQIFCTGTRRSPRPTA